MTTATKGYDPQFLGSDYVIAYPTLTGTVKNNALNNGEIFDFTNFSLVMNKETKFAAYSLAIINQSQHRSIQRQNDDWHYDERIGEHNQVGEEVYRNNDWDKGHLTRRDDVCWGEQAQKANDDSFCWANIALQHHDFNTGVWKHLEEWLIEYMEPDQKFIVNTGPVNKGTDTEYCGIHRPSGCKIKVPYGFWKSITFVNRNHELRTLAFIIRQYHNQQDNLNSGLKPMETYQVPLTAITRETEIEFDQKQYDTNPLFFFTNSVTETKGIQTPEVYLIEKKKDLIVDRNL